MPATTHPQSALPVRLLALLVLALLPAPLAAQTHFWNQDTPGSWSQSLLWTPNSVPNDPGHWAAIGVSSPTPYTVTLDMNAVLGQFTFGAGNATFSATGRTFTVNGPSDLTGTTVDWIGSTWNGPGVVSNSSHFRAMGNSSIENLGNAGLLEVLGSALGGHATLTVGNGFANGDRIHLNSVDANYSANLAVNNGPLTNNNLFETQPGAGGARSFTGGLVNGPAGVLRINQPATFYGGPFQNQGSWEVGAGSSQSFGSGVFFQNSGPLNLAGSFQLASGSFDWNGGAISGTPWLTSSALNLGAGNLDAGLVQMEGNSALSGDLEGSQTVRVRGNGRGSHATLTAAASFSSSGTISLDAADAPYSSNLVVPPGGTYTNLAGGRFEVLLGSNGSRSFTGAMDNQGTVELSHDTTFYTGPVTSSGAWTVGGGAIQSFGSGVGFTLSGGTLDIAGGFELASGTLSLDGGTVTGTPELTSSGLVLGPGFTTPAQILVEGNSSLTGQVQAGQTVHVQGAGRGSHATLSAPAGLVNAGELLLDSRDSPYQSNLTVSGGPLQNSGTLRFAAGSGGGSRSFTGELVNDGLVVADTSASFNTGPFTNNGDLQVAAGQTLTLANGTTFTQAAGSLQVDGVFLQTSGTVNLDGGAVTGVPELTGVTLNLGAGFTTPAELLVGGNSSLSGPVEAGQTVHVQGSGRGAHATLSAPAGLVNAGELLLDSRDSPYQSNLTVTGGPLQNNGTLRFAAGSGGGMRSLNCALENDGLVAVDTSTAFYTGPVVNRGVLRVAAGQLLSFQNNMDFTQESGTLQIDGGFEKGPGTVTLNGGDVIGVPEFTGTVLTLGPGFTSPAEISVQGNSSLIGLILAGQKIHVQGGGVGGQAILTVSTGLDNAGTLLLQSRDSSYWSNLTVTGGPLSNSGLIEIGAGAGGARVITADLVNTGTLLVHQPLTLTGTGLHTSSGLIRLDSSATLSVTGAGFQNQAGGRIEGGGSLDVIAAGGLQNDGALSPWGNGIGSLYLSGSVSSRPSSVLEIDLAGSTPGTDQDNVVVSGDYQADGTLLVRAASGFVPQMGDRFTVLTAGSLSGSFRQVETKGFPSMLGVRVEYQADALVLEVGWDARKPGQSPFRLGLKAPDPGLAGQSNSFTVLAAGQGKTAQLYYGTLGGHTIVPGCAGLALGIDNAQLLGSAVGKGAKGKATVVADVPASFSGQTVLFQALELSTCRVSNIVVHSFP